MVTLRFWIAVVLSGGLHISGVCLCVLDCWPWCAPDTPPQLIEPFGDSDREGFNVSAVALDPGTWRQGDQHTPGGDDAPDKPDKPTEASPSDEDTIQPVAMEPKPIAPALPSLPAVLPGPASLDTTTKTGLTGAAGGANMRIGTPSRGGTVGSATGIEMRSHGVKVYPAEAERLEQEGTPVVWLRISEEGTVIEAGLEKKCPYPLLDAAAVRFAKTMKFRPATREGVPVEVTIYIPIKYKLP